jgi:hypothetical protein
MLRTFGRAALCLILITWPIAVVFPLLWVFMNSVRGSHTGLDMAVELVLHLRSSGSVAELGSVLWV